MSALVKQTMLAATIHRKGLKWLLAVVYYVAHNNTKLYAPFEVMPFSIFLPLPADCCA
jgi:hypothetical protein